MKLGRLFAVVRKELVQLRRDRLTFAMIVGIPTLQLLLFGFAINLDIRHLPAALLDQAHVAVVPGNDSGFETHVRLSFATSMKEIDRGLDRIGDFLRKLG